MATVYLRNEPLKEPAVKTRIKKHLASIGAYYWMPPAGPFGKISFPDFVGCWRGRFFSIEAKGYGGRLTDGQRLVGERMQAAGGVWFLIDHKNIADIAVIMRDAGIGT